MGRPTKYDPKYCDQVIELGREGKSKMQMSSIMSVPGATFKAWEQGQPDFRAAMEFAMELAQAYWEDLGHDHLREAPGGVKLNAGLWSRSMSARFPATYSERAKVEVTGKDGGPIEMDHVHDFSKALLEDLLSARQADAEPDSN